MLSDLQIARYSRQIILPAVGGRGQQKLLAARVAVIGDEEMAWTAASYLAAAGIGELAIVGRDRPLADDLDTVNPDCQVRSCPLPATEDDAAALISRYDIVVDAGSPSALTGLLNTQCCAGRKPLVWGTAAGGVGQVAVFAGFRRLMPCYQCWQRQAAVGPPLDFGSAPDDAGSMPPATVFSAVVRAFIGTLQATETIKLALGVEPTLMGRLVAYDALDVTVQETAIVKRPDCPICSTFL
jgi:molybdopterin/thiamine biosynthesis adenylyltransferase